MDPGALVTGRFEVEELAAEGGMGSVYRCLDRLSGQRVALKVQPGAPGDLKRFEREAQLLAELRHPSIVRYVAHGLLDGGQVFLAMEWLDGESLEARLARGPLSIGETQRLAARLAEVLQAIHARGIVHRDLKPSNLFLPRGALEEVKLLDFGVAGLRRAGPPLTRSGAILGTPGYMAPEQARGSADVDARADLFSLGCVLFECLAGKPPFFAEDGMAVLAKILLEEAPPLHEASPDAPAALCLLVDQLCSRDRDERPRDASEVLGALSGMRLPTPLAVPRLVLKKPSLTGAEQRLLCVLLIDRGAPEPRRTLKPSEAPPGPSLRETVEAHQGKLEELAGGGLVATWSGAFAARDQLLRAARCALALRALLPGAPIALATGRGVALARSWAGEVISLAARLLRSSAGEQVLIDEVTARLISGRFETRETPQGFTLLRERELQPGRPTLLGKPSPCVGRDRELGALEGIYAECTSEPVALAALVTAPAGIGKTRLADELIERLRARFENVAPQVWRGRGDAMRAGSPFGLLSSAIRNALGVQAAEAPELRAEKVRARVARVVPAGEVPRVAGFLGELLGARAQGSALLEAARSDAQLMGDQLRRAFVEWLGAECAAQPVMLVLEDLHWGDLPTVKFLDAALRDLADRPLFVLGLARPEVHQVFPRLWAERRIEETRLSPLTPKAAARLVRAALQDAPEGVVERVVSHGEGNALHLEELIRAAAEQREGPPQTVLVMLHSRLEQLDPEARHVLRAASIFGQRCWTSGVAALLAGLVREEKVRDWLALLGEQEVLGAVGRSRFPGEEEHTFRHALVRDAAYAMLTEGDRALGHRLAREWLEKHGEGEAVVLAEHCERGGEPERAVAFYRRAAEQALEGDDVEAALSRARRALGCNPAEGERGALLLLCAEAHGWRGEHAEAAQAALSAMEQLALGSQPWFAAAGQAAEALGKLGDRQRLIELGALLDVERAPDARQAEALVRTAAQLFFSGRTAEALRLTARVEASRAQLAADVRASAFVAHGLSVRALFSGDLGAYRELKAAAAEGFERAGDRRNACAQKAKLGYANVQLGAFDEAEAVLRAALELAERQGLKLVSAGARHNLGLALALMGRLEEAEAVEREAILAFQEQRDVRLEMASRGYLSRILLLRGDLDGASREIRVPVGNAAQGSPARAHALAQLAEIQLAGRFVEGALTTAREAHRLLELLGGTDEGESQVRLVYAEALWGSGLHDEARAALQAAQARLRERAARIAEPRWRESFLTRVPENARTLDLGTQYQTRPKP